MTLVAGLAVVWIVVFGILILPARPIGRWMVRQGKGPISVILDIMICAVIAFNVALLGWLGLLVWGRDVFPHVKDDPMGFGLVFSAALLFVPAFLALLAGYLRARKAVEVDSGLQAAPVTRIESGNDSGARRQRWKPLVGDLKERYPRAVFISALLYFGTPVVLILGGAALGFDGKLAFNVTLTVLLIEHTIRILQISRIEDLQLSKPQAITIAVFLVFVCFLTFYANASAERSVRPVVASMLLAGMLSIYCDFLFAWIIRRMTPMTQT